MSASAAVLAAMRDGGLDALVLGREANTRLAAGTARLWLAGTRVFSPSCVVVRATGNAHVLATTGDAVPAAFPHANLYGLTWNPGILRAELQAIPGLADARRIGVDGMTPAMYVLLRGIAPAADIADAGALLRRIASTPSADATAGVDAAAAVATAGLDAMTAVLIPGVRPGVVRGACAAAFALHGVTTPAFDAVVAPLETGSSTWLLPERTLADGEVVVCRAGALCRGWEASLARTYVVAASSRPEPPPARWEPVVALCRAGARVGAVRAAGAIVYGVGPGVVPWDDDVVFAAGMSCALELADDAHVHQDTLRITDAAPVVLTGRV